MENKQEIDKVISGSEEHKRAQDNMIVSDWGGKKQC